MLELVNILVALFISLSATCSKRTLKSSFCLLCYQLVFIILVFTVCTHKLWIYRVACNICLYLNCICVHTSIFVELHVLVIVELVSIFILFQHSFVSFNACYVVKVWIQALCLASSHVLGYSTSIKFSHSRPHA